MAFLQVLVLASSLGYAIGTQICPQGSIDGKPFPCYDAGNTTTTALGTGDMVLPIVATMNTATSLMGPKAKTTTTTTTIPQPTPEVNCKCVDQNNDPHYQGMTPEGRPIPNDISHPDAVQKMVSQSSLIKPNPPCTTTCITAFPTYASPRVESTQTTLNGPTLLSPHPEITRTKLDGPTFAPSPHLASTQTNLDVPVNNLPHMTLPLTNEATAHLEHPGSTLDGNGFDWIPVATPTKQSQVLETTTTTTHYVIQSKTIVPGAPPVVMDGTTYSIAVPTKPVTTISGVTYTKSGPTGEPVVYINGQPKPADQVPGLQTDEDTGIASYIDQGIGGGVGTGYVTVTTSTAYMTSAGSTYFSQITQTITKSGSTLATSTAATRSATQTTSDTQALQTGSAAGRLTISAVCLGAVMFAMAML